MLALSDLRRFAKFLCGPADVILNTPDLKNLGPEPLESSFTYEKFKKLFVGKRGRIKQVLMNQSFIVGIGNIYSDDILYESKIHPLSRVEKLKELQLKALFAAIKKILKRGVKNRGTSVDDFRDTAGRKGNYGSRILVYQKYGQNCPHGHKIDRLKIGGRTAHFCPKEQKLYK
jgi:formamidopyrimidine-DNA glycosylase